MALAHVLGVPRIGPNRELKFAQESFWRGEIDEASLEAVASGIRQANWQRQHAAGLDFVTVGDFAFYDPMLNHIALLGCAPARFGFGDKIGLPEYFQLARGNTACHALEMTKWFDTNYHYLVPELKPATQFSLGAEWLFDEVAEAQTAGFNAKPVLIGPLTFLYLAKEKLAGFNRLDLLDRLLPVYGKILARLKAQGVEWVQIDEPILALDLSADWRTAFERAYHHLNAAGVKLMLASYFGPLRENLLVAMTLPVAGVHVDCVRGGDELAQVIDWLPITKVLSAGVIDGRNVWKTDLSEVFKRFEGLHQRLGDRLWLAPSCSLLHVPVSLAGETRLDPELKSWLAFADEKITALATLKTVFNGGRQAVAGALADNDRALAARRISVRVHDAAVGERLAALTATHDTRNQPFAVRQAAQRGRFRLPSLPTTTIGSFPQTIEIRSARARFKKGEISEADYTVAMQREIQYAVEKQEALGLDVLVHGEAERNDMVEYFGEQLQGYAFSQNGWVQSYGSRCVKPPIIYGDVSRPRPMTVGWTRYAQSLTGRPMKGMLTGPVTMLQWSFVRDDQPRSTTALQIALAIRDEVNDLEAAGIGIIQVDEPAYREGLPLRKADWPDYLEWASRAFRISASGVSDTTQIHTHMCYSEFNDILPAIAAMDADVITIETSRSDMELLRGFGDFNYPNEMGPGVYDIHSPRVPSEAEMTRLLEKAAQVIPLSNLWVNPDCGLKTRGWPETEAALSNMVAAAKAMRQSMNS
ncbi:MAG: 5-methyltetrahydropteroyltriglutamate--homocysteine S-methyltransferase [Thiobacillus sp.]|nr:MAG: 5-methyltetrahydropteroyltriglutamate--homocysteine S-methyltransferase [Hydrogenophilales bacterium 16-64-40]OZA31786.1 MAG: 5-methyltetrahydropteroyltriglutamate--homocysteine S-methyltransferase [Hydrogenophilales bacterium 17-64-65]HQT34284.1 5-methyltetrahydropteroyltriglutamate--homocysteine S-methyltransferase [Thiobacillus sp.]